MSACLVLRKPRVAVQEEGSQCISSTGQSASSLSPSNLDQIIMDMLNIHPEGSGVMRRFCTENPVTKAGKRIQMIRLLGIITVPIFSLLIMVSSIFVAQIQGYLSTKDVRNSITFSIGLSEFINVLQRERDMSAFYSSAIGPETKVTLMSAYGRTDHALDMLPDWVVLTNAPKYLWSRDAFVNYLNRHRYNLDLNNPTPQSELSFYTQIMRSFMSWFYSTISEARSGTVWKDLVATQELLAARDAFGIERAMGAIFYTRGGFDNMDEYRKYAGGYDRGMAAVKAAREFSPTLDRIFNDTLRELKSEQDTLYEMREEVTRQVQGGELKGVNKSLSRAVQYFDNMTASLDTYLTMQNFLIQLVEKQISINIAEETQTLIILGALFGVVLILCPLIIKSVYTLTTNIQSFSMKLVDRTKALNKEKNRTNSLLYQMLPKPVAEQLKNNEAIQAEGFSEATVFFSDIVGFTSISARSSPIQVVNMLNSLYTCFDNRILKYDVYKVETIGDAYMVTSGLPQRNGKRHVVEIANLSIDLMDQIGELHIAHMPGKSFRMRIGINTGSVVAGLVGTKMPRYCLFGKTVSTASLLESTGEAGWIHISESSYTLLQELGGFVMRARTDITKELRMNSYWLLGRVGEVDEYRTSMNSSPDNTSPIYADQMCNMKPFYDDQYDDDRGTLLIFQRASTDDLCENSD